MKFPHHTHICYYLLLLAAALLLLTTTEAVPPEPFTQDQCRKKLKPGQSLSLSSRPAICRTTRSGDTYQFGLVAEPSMSKTEDFSLSARQKDQKPPRECGDKAVCTISFPESDKPINIPDIACTMDVQYCGNDVYVGRDPANGCAFKPCPFQFCAGDTFYHPFCMPNHCRCGDSGGTPGCTKIACIDQCSDDSDCEAVVRSKSAQSEVYPLCQCEARSTIPFIKNRFDECLGQGDGNCAMAKCANTCEGLKAVCTKDKICALAPDTQCPSIDKPCMNAENHAACTDLERRGCSSITIMESCPLQFGCSEGNGEAEQILDPQTNGGKATLQLIRVGREGNVQHIWTATVEDGEPAVGDSLQLHENGNLAFYDMTPAKEGEKTNTNEICGGPDNISCPGDDVVCIFGDKNCDPDCGDKNCFGICGQKVDAIGSTFCGGFAGFQCPDSALCLEDKGDSCSPNCGGADCAGVCIVTSSVMNNKVDEQSRVSDGATPIWETGCDGDSNTRPRALISNVKTVFKKRQSIVKVVRKLPTSTKDWWVRGDGREVKKCARRRRRRQA